MHENQLLKVDNICEFEAELKKALTRESGAQGYCLMKKNRRSKITWHFPFKTLTKEHMECFLLAENTFKLGESFTVLKLPYRLLIWIGTLICDMWEKWWVTFLLVRRRFIQNTTIGINYNFAVFKMGRVGAIVLLLFCSCSVTYSISCYQCTGMGQLCTVMYYQVRSTQCR
jgi:hypothetical protein